MIPEHNIEGLKLWIERGIEPGSFLSAVLCNDLKEACAYADHINLHHIWDIVFYLWNYAPGNCWGSPEAFQQWKQSGGLYGLGLLGERGE